MTIQILNRPVTTSSALSGGRSRAAIFVFEETNADLRRLKHTYSIGLLPKGVEPQIFDELREIEGECSSQNWDGYGAAAVTRETIEIARLFLQKLPLGVPGPAVGADPDGDITFEWYYDPSRILSVSLGTDNVIHYACIMADRKYHGEEPFLGMIPSGLLSLIKRVAKDG
ncbi:MAG: hypothetical protein WBP29_03710 [Candidatus Zixiibacteriota bacterium]